MPKKQSRTLETIMEYFGNHSTHYGVLEMDNVNGEFLYTNFMLIFTCMSPLNGEFV